MKIYAMTVKGEHTKNEDTVMINGKIIKDGFHLLDVNEVLACIADGVGGNKAGDIASEFVCSEISKLEELTRESIYKINEKLIALSQSNENLRKMATTLSLITISKEKNILIHIGNTRIGVFQSTYLKQITEDHTTVNWLVKTGQITKKESIDYDKKNEITACLGGGNPALINSLVFEDKIESITKVHRIVITSDGIHDYVSDDDIEDIISNNELEEACKQIIDTATLNGSMDDKSIIIIDR